MTIHFVLLFNRQGKIRLSQWLDVTSQKDRARIVRDIHATVVKRGRKQSNIIEFKDKKVVYRRYASLFFAFCVDEDDNELIVLEAIHMFVVMLDVTFQNVSELDIIFRFDEAFQILHEFIIAGEMQETSKRRIIRIMEKANALEEAELGVSDPLNFTVERKNMQASIGGIPL